MHDHSHSTTLSSHPLQLLCSSRDVNAPRLRVLLQLLQLLNEADEAALVSAGELANLLAVVEDLEGGHGGDLALLRGLGVGVDVDLEEVDAGVLGGQALEDRADHAAGRAPGGGKVNDDLGVGGEGLLELGEAGKELHDCRWVCVAVPVCVIVVIVLVVAAEAAVVLIVAAAIRVLLARCEGAAAARADGLAARVALHAPPHRRVPVVLDGVVRPARQELGDLGPLVAEGVVGVQDDAVLLLCPGRLLDVRRQMVVPPFAALLADAALEVRGDDGPALGAKLLHQLHNHLVLLLCPGTLDELWVEDLLPAVQALHVGAVGEVLGDALPALALVQLDGVAQQLVLLLAPAALVNAAALLARVGEGGGVLVVAAVGAGRLRLLLRASRAADALCRQRGQL
eukprot:m.77034 g.77034  ORF g.77034 m.77034 type:complete len:398 (-) comp14674_c1_seq9:234-1427(-)